MLASKVEGEFLEHGFVYAGHVLLENSYTVLAKAMELMGVATYQPCRRRRAWGSQRRPSK